MKIKRMMGTADGPARAGKLARRLIAVAAAVVAVSGSTGLTAAGAAVRPALAFPDCSAAPSQEYTSWQASLLSGAKRAIRNAARPAGTSQPQWLAAWDSMTALNSVGTDWFTANSSEVQTAFATPASFIMEPAQNTLTGPPPPPQVANWHQLPATVETFKSAASLQAALSNGTVYTDAGAVLYDDEDWANTQPGPEQQYPGWYSSCAAKAVAVYNAINGTDLNLIVAPGISLRKTIVGGASGTDAPADYLADDIPEIFSTPSTAWNPSGGNSYVADYVDVQAQQYEATIGGGTPDSYDYLVQQAAGQVNSADPTATVLAGLTTNNLATSPHEATSAELEAAAESVKGIASGFWLNDPSAGNSCPTCTGPYPGVAVEGLNLIDTHWASWPNQ